MVILITIKWRHGNILLVLIASSVYIFTSLSSCIYMFSQSGYAPGKTAQKKRVKKHVIT